VIRNKQHGAVRTAASAENLSTFTPARFQALHKMPAILSTRRPSSSHASHATPPSRFCHFVTVEAAMSPRHCQISARLLSPDLPQPRAVEDTLDLAPATPAAMSRRPFFSGRQLRPLIPRLHFPCLLTATTTSPRPAPYYYRFCPVVDYCSGLGSTFTPPGLLPRLVTAAFCAACNPARKQKGAAVSARAEKKKKHSAAQPQQRRKKGREQRHVAQ